MKLKNISINLGLLVITTILFFGGIEVALRVTGLQTVKPNPPKIYQVSEDERISYELIPNISRKAYRQTVTTNSLGFRSAELEEEKETVVILGDSIAFGYGVKDSQTIAANLAEQIPEYNWLNTASPGYHLGMQTAIYETKLRELDPAMLMLVFHYNDFDTQTGWLDDMGIIRAPDWVPTETQCNPVEEGILKLVPAKCWLDVNSAFYKVVKKVVNMRNAVESLEDSRNEETPKADSITDDQIEMYLSQLDKLIAVLPEGMPRTFVIWPDRFMHSESRPILISEVKKRGLKVIDLYETFGNNVEVLGWDTVHPSAKAVNEAVDVIAPKLEF
ncbi:hypothetical protein HN512_02830 [Candidatus Peregrinibacteria bacterium]|jgi:lysophospholipase L1-like esterase|nr:hypothetical protein [Candidatus Peregrinibacteria bacterium]MBT3598747.1 hypothetical protein [Candidatus Peregrinibacteria bacterium]MBT6731243.1 hypothetical protein [Candidatus Peregrinibacteria bacterium]MBT7008821.1 hypothetical protein [Candidatus Peregrinibacteria bacterium]MBT7344564.1 hypothetical protein [Candidatus Peregrinibacteria bacterium]